MKPLEQRRGVWMVDAQDRVGILVQRGRFDLNQTERWEDPERGEFHLVAPNGTTLSREWVLLTELRQAKLAEIPASRRPSAKVGKALGYTP